jgi:tetratricopeptide (TPR) repeat protein
MQYFTLAGHQSHPRALHNLAQMYMYGLGTKPSCSYGVELYKQVAERGDWSAEMKIAHSGYLEGDYERSVLLYARLAEEGVKVAQINAAYMFSEGNGFYEENKDEIAFRLWKNAADQGDAAAQRILGDYYFYGRTSSGVDYKKAADQYSRAADKRNAHAMFNLGFMYQFGIGLDQDFHLAKRYYDMSLEAEENAYYPSTLAVYSMYVHRWIIRNFGTWLGIDPSIGMEPISADSTGSGASSKGASNPHGGKAAPSSGSPSYVPSWMKPIVDEFQRAISLEDALLEDILLVGLSLALAVVIFLRQHRREVPVQQQQQQQHPQPGPIQQPVQPAAQVN